jgi:predicted permease
MTAFFDILKESLRITTRNKLNSLLAVLILAAGLAGCIFAIGMGAALYKNDPAVIPTSLHVLGELDKGAVQGMRGRDGLALKQSNVAELNEMSLIRTAAFNVHTGNDLAARGFKVDGAWIDGAIFSKLGWRMALGRDFALDDFAASSKGEQGISGGVIIGDNLWRSEFGARTDIIGVGIIVDGTPRSVIGVLGPDYAFPNREQIYVPFRLSDSSTLIGRFFGVYAFLQPQAVARVKALLAARQAQRVAENGESAKQSPFTVMDLTSANLNTESRLLFSMLSLIGWLVLLLAATNVGGLMLVHWLTRTHEIATRSALGSSRLRLAGSAFLQSFMLVALALAIALLSMHFGMAKFENFLHSSDSAQVPLYVHFDLKLSMLAPIFLACLCTAIITTFPVLWHLRETNLMRELRGAERGNSNSGKLGLLLLVLQCFLSVAAVLLAIVCARGAETALNRDYGIHAPRTVVAQIRSSDLATQAEAAQKLLDKLRAHPDVELVSISTTIPQVFNTNRDVLLKGELVDFNFAATDENFAEIYGIKLRSGRWLANTDIGKSVVVIDPAAALQAFGDKNAIGLELRYLDADGRTEKSATVIGITEPVTLDFEQGIDRPSMFVPIRLDTLWGVSFTIRTRDRNPEHFLPTLERIGAAADQRVALFNVRTYVEAFERNADGFRLLSYMFAPMGLLALILTAVGLAALLGSLVARRMRQSAIRLALGAGVLGVLVPLLRPLLSAAFVGLILGTTIALPLSMKFSEVFYGSESLSYASILVTLIVVIVGLALACITPARRALRANPNMILKQE